MRSEIRINKFHAIKSSRGVQRFYKNLIVELERLNVSCKVIEVENANLFIGGLKDMLEPVQKPPLLGFKTSVIVHDMISQRRKYRGPVRLIIWCYYLVAFHTAKKLFVFSRSERDYIIKNFGNRLKEKLVLFTPEYSDTNHYSGKTLKDSLNVSNKYLIVTNNLEHKNSDVIESLLRIDVQIVVIGKKGKSSTNITYYEEVSDEEYWSAIKNCRTLICLSEDEGFNLPVYDTIRLGKTPIIRAISVHRELYNDNALFYNSVDELVAVLGRDNYSNNKEFKHKYRGWSVLV